MKVIDTTWRREVVYLWQRWVVHQHSSRAAAMAFRALFAWVPFLVLMMVIGTYLVDWTPYVDILLAQTSGVFYELVVDMVEIVNSSDVIQRWFQLSLIELVVGVGMVLYGLSGFLWELVRGFEVVWDREAGGEWQDSVAQRLLGLVVVGMIGVTAGVLLILSWGLEMISGFFGEGWVVVSVFLNLGRYLILPISLTGLFGVLFWMLPRKSLRVSDVWFPAVVTMLLFSLGQWILGWYFSVSRHTSLAGSASTIILFLLWVYYSSMIVLVGAELGHWYAYRFGSLRKSGILERLKDSLFG